MVRNITKQAALSFSALIIGSLILSATPAAAGYGSSPSGGGGQSNDAPVCNNSVPGKTRVVFVRKSGNSQIEIGWNGVDTASTWTIAYGKESGKYIYGMSNFGDGNSRSVKINMLPPGTYYAVVKANNGCMPGPFSDERKITVFNSGNVLGAKAVKTGGQVLGTKATPSKTPTATGTNTPTETVDPTPTQGESGESLNFFQRIIRFFTGR